MSGGSFVFVGVSDFQRALVRKVGAADVAARGVVTTGGHAIERFAKQNFRSGDPGAQGRDSKGRFARRSPVGHDGTFPNAITGTAKRSITVKGPTRRGGGWRSETGPTVVYGRRLELGFSGTDSLGRVYNQPPYPFLAPAMREALPIIRALHRDIYRKALI